jgi:hypothetical protein
MNFRNVLALTVEVGIIPAIWILEGMGIIHVGDVVIGATIAVWTLIAQFYFRKKEAT